MRRPTCLTATVLALFLSLVPVCSTAAWAAREPVPRAVTVARTTTIPKCKVFVDAAADPGGTGTARRPFRTIAAAIDAARDGAVICVAEGVYRESLRPGTKAFTLAGGFERGSRFTRRDSARFVTRAEGDGGSFLRIEDPGPQGRQLTAIDGFEITGYSQAIFRDFYLRQRFDLTNNHIHDNVCSAPGMAGAGFALNNVVGTISGNVIERNVCDRGGAGFINDTLNTSRVRIERNLITENAGVEPGSSHGGALYLFANNLTVTGNRFEGNSVTGWGAGLYLGAFNPGGQFTTGVLSWNVYRSNRAGNGGGGLFCDDGASCASDHEIFDSNCGSNIYLDGASGGGATVARFDHLTNVGALDVDCETPGSGVRIDKDSEAPDAYAFTNALFHGNARNGDFVATCSSGCDRISITINYSMVQRRYIDNGLAISFGRGIVKPKNPRFAAPAAGDFHLKSTFGRWTPRGRVRDAVDSPALAKGDPASPTDGSPKRAGRRTELGAYGNSSEASFVR